MANSLNFLAEYAISLYHCVMCKIMPALVSDRNAIVRHYANFSGGRKPNLSSPRRFSEKLAWYKLNGKTPLMETVANKYTVREYIKEKNHKELLNELIGVYTNVDDIDFESLPDKFVIKGTHGSGFNIIVRNKKELNILKTRLILKSWMLQDNYWCGREWVYKNMPRHIIIEKYLDDGDGDLRDYKFYCFNGEPQIMQLEIGRGSNGNIRNFYDMDWNLLPFGKTIPNSPDIKVDMPSQFDEMKNIARELSQPFQYVRVDLYLVDGKIYFGELTFFPAGGVPDFIPDEYDFIVGDLWKLEK